jgi:hypothetical protein
MKIQISNKNHLKNLCIVFISIYKRYNLLSYADSKQLFIKFEVLKINYNDNKT